MGGPVSAEYAFPKNIEHLRIRPVFSRSSPGVFIPALSHFMANLELDRYMYPASPAR